MKAFTVSNAHSLVSNAIKWHGDDQSGRRLPAGVYFVKLESSDYSEIKKVVMLR